MPKLEGIWLTVSVNVVLVLVQIAFGAYHVIGKEALNYINAMIYAFYREVISGPCLVVLAVIFERVKPDIPKDWWRFVLLGTTGVFLNQLLFIEGLALTSATQAAIMQPCIPVFTTALTLILRIEKFSVLKLVGILFSAGGAVVMVGVTNISFQNDQTKGMLCLLGNTFAMSVYYILQKPVLKKYPPISVTGWAYIIGSVEMGVTSLVYSHGNPADYGIDHHVIIPLVYSILFATIFTYMSLTWANQYAPASVVAAYSSLQPLTAALLSYFFLNQDPERDEYIGASAIIVGLGLVTYARMRENKPKDAETKEEYQPIYQAPDPNNWETGEEQEHAKTDAPRNRVSFRASDLPAYYPPDQPTYYPPDQPTYTPDQPADYTPDQPADYTPDQPAEYTPGSNLV